MNIHQLSVTYDPLEDRVLLRVNTTTQEEVRVWLTRRMLTQMLPHLPRVASEQLALAAPVQTALLTEQDKQTFADIKQQEHLHKSDFSTPFQTGETMLMNGDALLLTDLKMVPQTDGMALMVLEERAREGRSARLMELRMKVELLHGLKHLLQEVWSQTGWTAPQVVGTANPHMTLDAPPTGQLLN